MISGLHQSTGRDWTTGRKSKRFQAQCRPRWEDKFSVLYLDPGVGVIRDQEISIQVSVVN